jgi:hypothetical protein
MRNTRKVIEKEEKGGKQRNRCNHLDGRQERGDNKVSIK